MSHVPSGTPDQGPPIKVGGRYNLTPPTLTDGNRGDLQLDARGSARVALSSAGSAIAAATAADALASQFGVATLAQSMLFNGSTWDRARTPNVFKPIAAVAITSGSAVAIWTPAAGKKFRVMGFVFEAQGASAAMILKDATTEFARVGSSATSGEKLSPPMGNGYLSAAANNVLNLDVSANATVQGFVFGTEE